MNKLLKVAIIGMGLIGNRRAAVVNKHAESQLRIVCDINEDRARQAACMYCCQWSSNWEAIATDESINVIVVSTINKFLFPICMLALENGKHVLVEKPLGCHPSESVKIIEAAQRNNVLLKVGFNHRYHPAYKKLIELYNKKEIGSIFYIKSSYGHGGRLGYDKEWRGNSELAGGGELLDQGIHIIDLARNLIGDFTEVFGYTERYFWDIAPLEDNGFALLKNEKGQLLSIHASWTQWKNLFRFEVCGERGYLIIEGLGGSYGKETLRFGKRPPESGAPEETTYEFEETDKSWELEWKEFADAIIIGSDYQAKGYDGYHAVRLVHAIYESSQTGKKIQL